LVSPSSTSRIRAFSFDEEPDGGGGYRCVSVIGNRANRLCQWGIYHFKTLEGADVHLERKSRAFPGLTTNRDRSPKYLRDSLAYRQAQSRASEPARDRVISLNEGFEDCLDPILRYAYAGIGHVDSESRAATIPGDLHDDTNLPFVRELDGVSHQIHEQLLEAERVCNESLRSAHRLGVRSGGAKRYPTSELFWCVDWFLQWIFPEPYRENCVGPDAGGRMPSRVKILLPSVRTIKEIGEISD
jgi:hypothetical protein